MLKTINLLYKVFKKIKYIKYPRKESDYFDYFIKWVAEEDEFEKYWCENGVNLSGTLIKFIEQDFLSKVSTRSVSSSEKVLEFRELVVEGRYTSNQLFLLYKGLTVLGCFKLSGVVREIVEEKISKSMFKRYFYPDLGGENNILTLLDRKYQSGRYKGKKIAIIGPSESKYNYEELLDFDLLVILGYQELSKFKNLSKVVYLNDSVIDRDDSWYQLYSKDSIDIVFKGNNRENFLISKYVSEKNGRFLVDINLQWWGVPNLLQVALLDIFFHGGRDVFIYNCNFYLSKDTFSKDYKLKPLGFTDLGAGTDFYNLFKVFAGHDPYSQIEVTKSLGKVMKIDGDNLFTQAISCNSDKYLDSLEKAFLNRMLKLPICT